MCDPETRLQQQSTLAAIAALQGQNPMGLNLGHNMHGLPNIGEDSML